MSASQVDAILWRLALAFTRIQWTHRARKTHDLEGLAWGTGTEKS